MKIDFERMEDMVIPNFKNGTGIFVAKMFDDKKTKIMRATLAPGSSVGLHAHNDSSEIIYILSGGALARYTTREMRNFPREMCIIARRDTSIR